MEYEILTNDGKTRKCKGKRDLYNMASYLLYETNLVIITIWKNRKCDGQFFDITKEILTELKFI